MDVISASLTDIQARLDTITLQVARLSDEFFRLEQARDYLRGLTGPTSEMSVTPQGSAPPPPFRPGAHAPRPRKGGTDAPAFLGGPRYRAEVVAFLAGGPKRTGEIAADLKVDVHTARKLLTQFQREGLLEVKGSTISRRWSLTAKGARGVVTRT